MIGPLCQMSITFFMYLIDVYFNIQFAFKQQVLWTNKILLSSHTEIGIMKKNIS